MTPPRLFFRQPMIGRHGVSNRERLVKQFTHTRHGLSLLGGIMRSMVSKGGRPDGSLPLPSSPPRDDFAMQADALDESLDESRRLALRNAASPPLDAWWWQETPLFQRDPSPHRRVLDLLTTSTLFLECSLRLVVRACVYMLSRPVSVSDGHFLVSPASVVEVVRFVSPIERARKRC